MKSLLLLLCLFTAIHIQAQAPQGFQYQAVLRDANGDPMLNTNVRFRFSIEHTSGNPIYYQETQQTISNALGGINLAIGAGNALQGNFSLTDWKSGEVRVRVELDPTGGQNYSPFGLTTLQSVPYALYADKAGVLVDGNGNDWSPEDDQDEQTLSVNGNQLEISNGNAVLLPTGSGGDNWGSQTIVTESELTGNGTLGSPLGITTQGASNGDVLKWNGNAWTPQDDNGAIYTEGTGIDINGNTISATNTQAIWNANFLQNLNVSPTLPSTGQVLKWDGGVWAPGADNGGSYTEGTGININGNVISAENTVSQWNANQLRGFNIVNVTPGDGQYLRYTSTAGGWVPSPGPATTWQSSGNNIYYSAGNVGFGLNNPLERIHVFDEDKIRMDDQTFGKFGSISMEFTSNIIPEIDDARDLGLASRRWDDVYASSGIVNTSDAREKENIHSISYGLADIMKLNPVSFTWKNKPEKGTKLGLIAQELETVIPEVVSNPDRTPSANSEPEATGETRLGVYYSDLIPVLIKAIQEQEEKIIQLQAEVEALKKK